MQGDSEERIEAARQRLEAALRDALKLVSELNAAGRERTVKSELRLALLDLDRAIADMEAALEKLD